MFAKLYETEEFGQILVKLDEEEGVEIRFFFTTEGLGVCSLAHNFKDSEEADAWDKADYNFNKIDEARAIEVVSAAIKGIGEVLQEG